MVDHYQKLGLLTEIDATGGINEVYLETKKALVKKEPNVVFMFGGPGAGKGT